MRINFKNHSWGGWLMFILGLALPFKDQISTAVMITMFLVAILYFRKKDSTKLKLSDARWLWVPAVLLIPRLLGFFTGDLQVATNELIRSMPLVLLPLIFLGYARELSREKIERLLYLGLLAGILLTMAICEFIVFKNLITNDQPLSYLMRWRYMNFNFTQPIDVHPAYLGLIIIYIQAKSLFNPIFGRWLNMLIILLLTILLFQLIARNAIIINVLLLIGYGVYNKASRVLILTLAALFAGIILFHPSDYLRNKYLYVFKKENSIMEDTRFGRLKASILVFKTSPLWGVGPGNDNKLRKEQYLKLGEEVAFKNDYNAHNQYFEYLVTSGIVGFLCFVFVLLTISLSLFKIKDWSNLFLVLALGLACFTESLLERSLGIKYFGILMGVALISISHQLITPYRKK